MKGLIVGLVVLVASGCAIQPMTDDQRAFVMGGGLRYQPVGVYQPMQPIQQQQNVRVQTNCVTNGAYTQCN